MSTLDRDAALGALLAGRGVDVMVLVGTQPADWLAALPPATTRALKLLRLDRQNPADQRLLQAYLPATLRPAPDERGPAEATPTLAVMSFLVTTADKTDADASRAAQALCAHLPALRRDGEAKWREVRPALQLETGWPTAPGVTKTLQSCAVG